MRGVVVGLAGLFRGQAPLRRKWGDVSALAPVVVRARQSGWLTPLPTPEEVAAAMAAVGAPAALLGHPGVSASAQAWAGPLGLTVAGAAMVAVLGPDSVEAAVDAACAAGRRVAVACPDDGEGPVEPPPGGLWLADAWAGEGTRGIFGLGVLTALGLAGLDVRAALSGAAAMAELSRGPLADNPAWSLARALRMLAQESDRDAVVHVAGSPELSALAQWAARAQAAALAAPSPLVPGRPLPVAVGADDPDWARAALENRHTAVVVWEVAPGAPLALYADSDAPVLRVTLPGLDAEALGGTLRLWLGALEALSLLEERPLPT